MSFCPSTFLLKVIDYMMINCHVLFRIVTTFPNFKRLINLTFENTWELFPMFAYVRILSFYDEASSE